MNNKIIFMIEMSSFYRTFMFDLPTYTRIGKPHVCAPNISLGIDQKKPIFDLILFLLNSSKKNVCHFSQIKGGGGNLTLQKKKVPMHVFTRHSLFTQFGIFNVKDGV